MVGNYIKFWQICENPSQQFKDLFVDHLGIKELLVHIKNPHLQHSTQKDWKELIDIITEQISLNTKQSLNHWIQPNFTTTNLQDIIVAKLAIMSTVSEYFI